MILGLLKGFLGYFRTQKGYKCFCPSIFAIITFFKSKPGFSHLLFLR